MIIKLFKSNRPTVIFLIPIVLSILWLFPYFLKFSDIQRIDLNIVMYQKFNTFFSNFRILEIAICILLISLQSIFLNSVFNRNEFYQKNIYLPALIYGVLMSAIPHFQYLNPVLIANTFIIIALSVMFRLKKQEDAKGTVFIAAFFMGIGACLYLPYVILMVSPFIALIVIRPFVWREYFLSILGFLVPFLYFFAIRYIVGDEFFIPLFYLTEEYEHFFYTFFDTHFYLRFIFIAIFFIINIHGFYIWFISLNTGGLRYKRLNQINFLFFVIVLFSAISEFIFEFVGMGPLILALPLTLILPFGLTEGRNKSVPTFLWYSYFLSIFAIYFFDFVSKS